MNIQQNISNFNGLIPEIRKLRQIVDISNKLVNKSTNWPQ